MIAGKKIVETPLMRQFFAVKAEHPEAILLFRVGDFYETYGEDAVMASKILGIVLTKRANGAAAAVEMAGFPHHSIDTYLPKLVRAGHKVAVCDQLEDPKFAKKLVKRGVTELVTPGVAYNEQLLPQKENNYLASLFFEKERVGVAFLDISTGDFRISEGSLEYIEMLLSSFSPKEILLQKGFEKGFKERFPDLKCYFSSMEEWAFVFESSYQKLLKQFSLTSLKGFGVEKLHLGLTAAGAVLFYLENNQLSRSELYPTRGLSHICSISRIDEGEFVWLDRFTIRNLEITTPVSTDGTSLLDVIDKCSCAMGGRLLRTWITMPSKKLSEIASRHDVVETLLSNRETMNSLREKISELGDIERIISRAAAGRITPREALQLRRGLDLMLPIKMSALEAGDKSSKQKALKELIKDIDDCHKLKMVLARTLAKEPAAQIGKGDVIATGVNRELDELRNIVHNGKRILSEIEERETQRTGISSLKISYNNVFGYYLEVRNTHKDKVPPEWIRKQTLVSAERYITQELKEYEEKIFGAEEKIVSLEQSIFSKLILDIQENIPIIQKNSRIIAKLDCLLSFALCAEEFDYCRPEMNDSRRIEIKQGRHPVIERNMPEGERYIANDLLLDSDSQQIIILTGPNMSGKSALLRQTALIVLMAQIGSFVPASAANIGYVDKIFTRVGASDNISRGESTFMVEMLETATILHNLSPRSLILLDEIGRGTSTYDGMSIAWAIVEYLHQRGEGAKTLFATHYHELNELQELFPRVKNFHISVKEIEGKILFLRLLCEGGVAHSFGIHVAKLAGMPREVVHSAEKILKKLEESSEQPRDSHKREFSGKKSPLSTSHPEPIQLSLFQLEDPLLAEIRNTLKEIDLNQMSPMDTFDLIRDLKKKIGL